MCLHIMLISMRYILMNINTIKTSRTQFSATTHIGNSTVLLSHAMLALLLGFLSSLRLTS